METWKIALRSGEVEWLAREIRNLHRRGIRLPVDIVGENKDIFILALYENFGLGFIQNRVRYQLESQEVAYFLDCLSITDIITSIPLFSKTLDAKDPIRNFLMEWGTKIIGIQFLSNTSVYSCSLETAIEKLSLKLPSEKIQGFDTILKNVAAKRLYKEALSRFEKS